MQTDCWYDMDTSVNMMPNFLPNDKIRTFEESQIYDQLTKDVFTTIYTKKGDSLRGKWFKYARLFKNKIMAIGVRLPDPNIFPPSRRDNSPLVR